MASRTAIDPTAKLAPDAPVTSVPGIGPSSATRLAAVGIRSVFDLVAFFPRRCRPLRELASPEESAVGELVRLAGTVHTVRTVWLPGRRAMTTVVFATDAGTFEAPFFNQPWLKKNYPAGQRRLVEGVLQQKGRRWLVQQARVLPLAASPSGEVQLRYADIEGIGGARLQQWLAHALGALDWPAITLPKLPPGLDDFAAEPAGLLLAMHRPKTVADHEQARRHFAVREALALFSAVERAARARAQRPARCFPVDAALAARIRARLPFTPSQDQEAALAGLWTRLQGPAAMGVLLQGDVGTGKTAVAVGVALAVLARGASVAFLAPTELLAEQHHRGVAGWLQGSGVAVRLCTATNRGEIAGRGPQLVFGTHALLGDALPWRDLALVVVDEQHRFGVQQRMALVQQGDNPHVLVMTATPIPRTLTLVRFGDLDVVTLRQRPQQRPPVRAFHLPADRWTRVLRSIARAVRRRGRVFVVCPAVGEDGEKGGVVRMQEALAQRFRCGLVHGRQAAGERQAMLQSFRDGGLDVLIGTTVLEVGVDVPDATLIVVAAADRFGIATLHQLRGRVGRGARRGLCILCGPRTERVAAVCRTTDGFQLAEADLALRGSGELLGTAQSGFADLKALDPVDDLELLQRVRQAVHAQGVGEP